MRMTAEALLWGLTSTALYLLLVTSPTGLEVPVGIAIGAVCAAVGMVTLRAFRPPTQVPSFVRRILLLPVDLAGDTVTLTRMVLTGEAFRAEGEEDEVVLPDDDQTRAWAVLLTSAAPGSLAADVEERDDSLVLRRHRLTGHHHVTDGWDLG